DQFHVAEKSAVRHSVAPAGVILMDVCAFKIVMLAVQEKSVVSREPEPAETQRRRVIIHRVAAVEHDGFYRVKIWMFRRPELWICNGGARLVKRVRGICGEDLCRIHFRNSLASCIEHAGLHSDGLCFT